MEKELSHLKSLLKTTAAQLLSHSQTVQELLKANMELRAALHLLEADKRELQDLISGASATKVTNESVESADTVSA